MGKEVKMVKLTSLIKNKDSLVIAILLCSLVPSCNSCKSYSSPELRSGKVLGVEDEEQTLFSCPVAPSDVIKSGRILGESSSQLFVDLYKSEKKAGNYLVSPFSIQSGLSLLLLGAKDSTSSSLSSLLHINESKAKLVHKEAKNMPDNFNRLINATNRSFVFVSANNVFLDENVPVKKDYEEKVKCFYGSNVTSLSMRRSPDESADQINAWVEQRTRGKIQKLIQSSSLENSQAVLVNTLYFKAPWVLPFKYYTRKANFTMESGNAMEVDMMLLEGRLPTGLIQGVRVIQLDYKTCVDCPNSDMAMFVFVPEDSVSLEQAERVVMDSEVLSGRGLTLRTERVRLFLPKFEVRHKSQLSRTLRQLGLPVHGDYTGITNQGLQVDEVVHEAVLRVDEKGSEGAAATAIFTSRMMFVPKTTINVDRTFFLSVVHKQSGVTAFAAKVNQIRFQLIN